jgi:hypothetical protein
MLRLLSKFFRIKTKELEAKLFPTPDCSFGGLAEIEAKLFGDNSAELKLSLKHSGVRDGSNLEFYSSGVNLGSAECKGGYAKIYKKVDGLNSKISLGSKAELRIDGKVLYTGEFRPD